MRLPDGPGRVHMPSGGVKNIGETSLPSFPAAKQHGKVYGGAGGPGGAEKRVKVLAKIGVD